jgi:hypothetical protein
VLTTALSGLACLAVIAVVWTRAERRPDLVA